MKNILLGGAVAVALLSLCGAADAAPLFEVSINGGNIVSTPSNTLNEASITLTAGAAKYSIADINAQYTTVNTGTGSVTTINFNGSSIKRTAGTGTTTLTIALTLTDVSNLYLPTISNNINGNDANNGGATHFSTTATAFYIDAGDAPFAKSTLVASATPATSKPSYAYSITNSQPVASQTAPYSVTLIRTLTFTGNNGIPASFSGISSISSVPEPASLTLLGTGLLGAGFMFSRRRKSNAAA